jgi:uncharacterized protein YuzE
MYMSRSSTVREEIGCQVRTWTHFLPREKFSLSDSSMTADWHFILDGDEPLGFDYDDDADVLYLWRGEGPREAIGLTTPDGHVVRLDEETGEIVGFTIFNFFGVWAQKGMSLKIEIPDLEAAQGSLSGSRHELELVPA